LGTLCRLPSAFPAVISHELVRELSERGRVFPALESGMVSVVISEDADEEAVNVEATTVADDQE
jgi:hypothetical protein